MIIQLPVNNSPPIIITSISPTGNTAPARVLESPTLLTVCMARLEPSAPIAINKPAKNPIIIILITFRLAFVTPVLMLFSTIWVGLKKFISIFDIISCVFYVFHLLSSWMGLSVLFLKPALLAVQIYLSCRYICMSEHFLHSLQIRTVIYKM